MTTQFFLNGMLAVFNGEIDLLNDTLKAALVGVGYTPDQNADQYFDDISAEISGTGYTAGGQALQNAALLADSTMGRVEFNAADLTWVTATISAARAMVIYKSTGTASTSPLLCYIDLGDDYSSTGEDFTVAWDAGGIFSIPI